MKIQRKNQYSTFRFRIEVDGIQQAGFSEATLSDPIGDVTEFREGTESILYTRKQPSLIRHGMLVLKGGVTKSKDLCNWCSLIAKENLLSARKNVTLIVVDEDCNEAMRWQFSNAFPIKYEAPEMRAKGNDLAIETLEIAFESMERIS